MTGDIGPSWNVECTRLGVPTRREPAFLASSCSRGLGDRHTEDGRKPLIPPPYCRLLCHSSIPHRLSSSLLGGERGREFMGRGLRHGGGVPRQGGRRGPSVPPGGVRGGDDVSAYTRCPVGPCPYPLPPPIPRSRSCGPSTSNELASDPVQCCSVILQPLCRVAARNYVPVTSG